MTKCEVFMRKPSVLIVEDDSAMRRLYALTLALDGFDVRAATNGLEALDSLVERRPDVVLTDIQMPVMDGIELLGCIRKSIGLANLPVLVLSACDKTFLQKAGVAGATKIIEKPIDPADLYNELWRLLPSQGRH
jgi:CheY-like chemotaxis protein